MSATLARQHVLPWDIDTEVDQRFRRLLLIALGIFLVVSVTLPFLPVQAIHKKVAEHAPILTRIILEKKVLPKPEPRSLQSTPTPAKKIVKAQPKPVQKPEMELVSRPAPSTNREQQPEETLADAREKAQATGVLAFRDDLQSLRDSVDVDSLNQTRTSRGVAQASEVQRAVITRKGPSASGGIRKASLSTDRGGPALSGRETSSVNSDIAGNPRAGGGESAASARRQGGRSDDDIRRVMDRNKGAIFALYNRALRSDPLLEGRLVFEMVIHPDGHITELNIISSELADQELTRRILSRIKLIQFGEENVLSTRVNYSFDFLPYT